MMSPTNPSRPAKLTAAPASTAARPSMASLVAPTFIPSACAVSSPRAMMLSLPAESSATARPPRM